MADQGRWFKLWVSSQDDPDLCILSIADFGRWCKFGTYLKVHGTDGTVTLSPPLHPHVVHPLQTAFQVDTFAEIFLCISRFPNCTIGGENSVAFQSVSSDKPMIVTWRNWRKYQSDFSTPRVQKHRAKSRENETHKRRGEEKRGEEKRSSTPLPPAPSPSRVNGWGSPEDLMALYNSTAPDELPSADMLSDKRKQKAKRLLKQFPDRQFWEDAIARFKASRFLRGLLPPTPPHTKPFCAGFNWLLSAGPDGIENVVNLWEGKYDA